MKGELNRVIMVYIDSYDNDVPIGRFCSAAGSDVKTFRSLSQMLIMIEKSLDETKFPQAFDQIRSFRVPESQTDKDKEVESTHPGKKATFAIRVLFRQNASWQGSVIWTEGNQEESFRSVLELIVLIDSALHQ